MTKKGQQDAKSSRFNVMNGQGQAKSWRTDPLCHPWICGCMGSFLWFSGYLVNNLRLSPLHSRRELNPSATSSSTETIVIRHGIKIECSIRLECVLWVNQTKNYYVRSRIYLELHHFETKHQRAPQQWTKPAQLALSPVRSTNKYLAFNT